MTVKIRFNTDYPKKSTKKWRIIVMMEGYQDETLVDEFDLQCPAKSSEEDMEIKGEMVRKYHVSCEPKGVVFNDNEGVFKATIL
jgi:hypothetical protein